MCVYMCPIACIFIYIYIYITTSYIYTFHIYNNFKFLKIIWPITKDWSFLICLMCSVQKSKEQKIAATNLISIYNKYDKNVHYKNYMKQYLVFNFVSFTVIFVAEFSCAVYGYCLLTFHLHHIVNHTFIFSKYCVKIKYAPDIFPSYSYLDFLSNSIKFLSDTLVEIKKNLRTDHAQLVLEINGQ